MSIINKSSVLLTSRFFHDVIPILFLRIRFHHTTFPFSLFPFPFLTMTVYRL